MNTIERLLVGAGVLVVLGSVGVLVCLLIVRLFAEVQL